MPVPWSGCAKYWYLDTCRLGVGTCGLGLALALVNMVLITSIRHFFLANCLLALHIAADLTFRCPEVSGRLRFFPVIQPAYFPGVTRDPVLLF